MTEAQADTLVSYVEQLERDLRQCEIVGQARADSLRVQIEIMDYKMAMYKDARARWYQDPRIWFLFGAAAATVVMGSAVKITF